MGTLLQLLIQAVKRIFQGGDFTRFHRANNPVG
jgi:hypothetical protein